MCFDLTSLTAAQRGALGLNAITTIVDHAHQSRATSANNAAVSAAKEAELDQISDQENQQLSERARQARQERSRIRVATAEAGVGGALVDRLINVSDFDTEFDVDNIRTNADNKRAAANARATAQLQTRPSFVAPFLKIATSGAVMAADNPSRRE